MSSPNIASSGLKGLDTILQHLRKGDNVVWQVDYIEDYQFFLKPYVEQALKDNKRLVYIRFAQHQPLIEGNSQIKFYQLDARNGFESFAKEIHEIITKEGLGAYYVFDCLSDLLSAWATDLMIGNFFMVTCPYLFKLDTVAYFAILRNRHSFKTIARIRETTQVLMDVYNYEWNYYVHPLKVWNRYSPTMFLPHLKKEEAFIPLTSSVDATRLLAYISSKDSEGARRNLDYWDRLFIEAEELLEKSPKPADVSAMIEKICEIMIGRENRMLGLVKELFTLEDLLTIKNRIVGTGFIGGKSVGMLLARNILLRDSVFDWQQKLEPHDSFFIGADIFYSYLVQNGWWELWLQHKTDEGYFKVAAELKEKMLTGTFPDETKEQFYQMIEYYGQAPIIVRSSSLLEDSFGNAFAGKYESIFICNQGGPEERYAKFEETVRQVFASTLSEDALTYRLQRGLHKFDEQMALLVQRVSGAYHANYFYPFLAGVGVSYNPFVWHEDMDPRAGMIRLVFGLGTRAVNRVEGDYPRIVALDAPLIKGMDDLRRFSQHDVDLLNIQDNTLQTMSLNKVLTEKSDLKIDLVAVADREGEEKLKSLGDRGAKSWVLTFEKLFNQTDFIAQMRQILKVLQKTYNSSIDIEFTYNLSTEGEGRINLVQCRPLQTKTTGKKIAIPLKADHQRILFQSTGDFMGGSTEQKIQRLIYIDPKRYSQLLCQKKYEIARLIGKLNRQIINKTELPTMLLGPGRWGTSDATLGVPVSFAEINKIAVLVEVAYPGAGYMPEVSFGSHFFLDLIETQIFYIALFPDNSGVFFDQAWIGKQPNQLSKLLPDEVKHENLVKVIDLSEHQLQLLSDMASQRIVCYK